MKHENPPARVVKERAKEQVISMAEMYRGKLASKSAGKLAEYRVKEAIAANPQSASAAELALIDREAKVRGTNRKGLLGMITARSAAYRQIALLIGVLEAEANTAIDAVKDDEEAEAAINHIMKSAEETAKQAFAEAVLKLSG